MRERERERRSGEHVPLGLVARVVTPLFPSLGSARELQRTILVVQRLQIVHIVGYLAGPATFARSGAGACACAHASSSDGGWYGRLDHHDGSLCDVRVGRV